MSSNPVGTSSTSVAPKILLAKPSSIPSGTAVPKFLRAATAGSGEDDGSAIRTHLSALGNLNLLSDSWEFHIDRILPFLTDNTEFTVVGVIGPPGVGKSTILNELYGFDGSPGMLPSFTTQTEETRSSARHCSVGIELRASTERFILLDTQPIFSPSILVDMTRPDGSSSINVLGVEPISADLAHDLMGIQLGVFLLSICHILLVVSEGVRDISMWDLMQTVDLLKHGIPDPSSLASSSPQNTNAGSVKEVVDSVEGRDEYLATPVFVHTKLRPQELTPMNRLTLQRILSQYFSSSSFKTGKSTNKIKDQSDTTVSSEEKIDASNSILQSFCLPIKLPDDSQRIQYESFPSSLGQLRDQILAMDCRPFAKPVSEQEWLRNSARIWEMVKKSPVIAEYGKTLQSSRLFRR